MCEVKALKELIKRKEMAAARCGDEYLKKVCRSDLGALYRQLAELQYVAACQMQPHQRCEGCGQ